MEKMVAAECPTCGRHGPMPVLDRLKVKGKFTYWLNCKCGQIFMFRRPRNVWRVLRAKFGLSTGELRQLQRGVLARLVMGDRPPLIEGNNFMVVNEHVVSVSRGVAPMKRDEMKRRLDDELQHIPRGERGSHQNELRMSFYFYRRHDLSGNPESPASAALLKAINRLRGEFPDFSPLYDGNFFGI